MSQICWLEIRQSLLVKNNNWQQRRTYDIFELKGAAIGVLKLFGFILSLSIISFHLETQCYLLYRMVLILKQSVNTLHSNALWF